MYVNVICVWVASNLFANTPLAPLLLQERLQRVYTVSCVFLPEAQSAVLDYPYVLNMFCVCCRIYTRLQRKLG